MFVDIARILVTSQSWFAGVKGVEDGDTDLKLVNLDTRIGGNNAEVELLSFVFWGDIGLDGQNWVVDVDVV